MGNAVPKDVHEAFRQVCYDFGVDRLAAMMGMPPGTLYNKCNLNETNHHKPTGAEFVLVTLLTGDKRIPRAFSQVTGGVHVDLPDLSNISTDALLLHILKIEDEGGDFYHEVHNALAGDNRISAQEFADIEREAHKWIGAILEGLARMREMAA
jgi:hypothetical protein